MLNRTRLRPKKTDVLAAVLFCCLFSFFLIFLRHGLNAALSDESYYYAMPYRFLQGDRMLVDEWYLTQFLSVPLMPVMKLYLALRGGTDGLLLFFRCLFLLFLGAVYWLLYREARGRGIPAAVAVFVFCLSVPFTVFSFSYYAVALYLFAVVCAVLFLREKRLGAPTLVLLGVLYSVAVFCEPGLLSAWGVLAVLTAVKAVRERRGKTFLARYGAFLSFRTLGLTAAGGAVCGGSALLFLALKSGISNVLRALPLVFSDPEHIAPFSKLLKLLFPFTIFGVVPYLFCAVFVLAAFAYRLSRRRSRAVKAALFVGACVSVCTAMTVMLVRSFRDRVEGPFTFLLVYPYLFGLLGLELYCLSDGRDPRTVPFLFAGLCLSVSADMFSEATFGFGGTLILFYLADAMPRLLKELRAEAPDRAREIPAARERVRRGCCIASAALLVAASALWQARYCVCFASPQYEIKAALNAGTPGKVRADTKLDRGPLRGLYTSASVSRQYDALLDDLDAVNASGAKLLYIPDLSPYLYLYSPLRSGTLSVFFEGDYVYDRQTAYWALLPEKRPDAIYVPNDRSGKRQIPAEKLEFIRNVCDYEAQRLGAGILFRVTNWKI